MSKMASYTKSAKLQFVHDCIEECKKDERWQSLAMTHRVYLVALESGLTHTAIFNILKANGESTQLFKD